MFFQPDRYFYTRRNCCSIFLDDPDTLVLDNHLFSLNASLTGGSGDYEFCSVAITDSILDFLEAEIEECLLELVLFPDGDTIVSIDSGFPFTIASREGLLHSDSSGSDVINYKLVSEQATSGAVNGKLPEQIEQVKSALLSAARAQLQQ